MKAFFDISAECYVRFALYSKTIMVHVIHKNVMYHLRHKPWLIFSTKSLTHTCFYIYVHSAWFQKKRFKIVILKTIEIIKPKNL